MKKILFLALSATVLFASCSKKSSNNVNPANTNTVTINGTDYATVKIGTQTWTAVNYNGSGGVNYNGNSTNNPTYGKLYSLTEAQAVILPSGWRLPTKADAEKLLTYLGATGSGSNGIDGDATVSIKLKSKSDWTYTQGNNSSGFNAFPAGDLNGNTYEGLNLSTIFWTSSADQYSDQYVLIIANLPDGPNIEDAAGMDYIPTNSIGNFKTSIRFVKDN